MIVGKQTVWRVPAAISFPSLGRIGVVGTVCVDVESGEMEDLGKCKAKIERYLEEEIKPKLPPYKMRQRVVPPEFIPKDIYLNDPEFNLAPMQVSHGDFDLAWFERQELYAVLRR